MSKKLIFLLGALLVLVLGLTVVLSACNRSASKSPSTVPTTTAGSKKNTPEATPVAGAATDDPIQMLYAYATQTALAGGGQALPTFTVTPGGPTVTPILPSPTATSVLIVPTATPGLPTSYTIQQGEYPYCIARRFNLNPEELLALNGLVDGELINPGLVLTIPQSGNPFPGQRSRQAHPASYTVRSGDTIYSIACLFGDVNPLMIAQINNLVSPYTLSIGTLLNIP